MGSTLLDRPEVAFLVLLITGHVFADFLVQTRYVAETKLQKPAILLRHGLLTLVTHGVLVLPFLDRFVLAGLVGLGLFHTLIDGLRGYLVRESRRPLLLFFSDQALHIGSIVLLWRILLTVDVPLAEPHWLPLTRLPQLTTACLITAGYVFNGRGGTTIVRQVLEGFPLVLPGVQGGTSRIDNMGRTIGCLERYLIFTLVLIGEWGALGFVLAAKSIARFRELENQAFADYYLIGTLTSVVVAVATGITIRLVLGL